MKLSRILTFAAMAAMFASCCNSPKVEPAIPYDADLEDKVEKVLKGMTLEEKIGQMTQISVDAVSRGGELTAAGDSIIRTYKVGSILNVPDGYAQTPAVYNKLIAEINRISIEEHYYRQEQKDEVTVRCPWRTLCSPAPLLHAPPTSRSWGQKSTGGS